MGGTEGAQKAVETLGKATTEVGKIAAKVGIEAVKATREIAKEVAKEIAKERSAAERRKLLEDVADVSFEVLDDDE
jgi:predicted hydrocarbon binding protein